MPQLNERNTPAWAFGRFRADALPRLLDDLGNVSLSGIDEADCRRVKAALSEIATDASNIPDGGVFRKSIYQHIEKYSELYSSWNEVKGRDGDARIKRERVIREIRSCRNDLAKATRVNLHILNNGLDLKTVDKFYAALGKLVDAVPSVFSNLSKAVARYLQRRG